MTNALAHAAPGPVVMVPEPRVLAMIASCAEQIDNVSSIDDAKKCTDMAEAVAAITRKVNVAKEVKRSAIRLLIQAEAKLGEILRAIPKKRSAEGRPPKRDVLIQHGISKSRASHAERLSKANPEEIERVVESGARTIHGVMSKLGYHTDGYTLRERRASAIAFLCEEAVDLLDRSVKDRKVPHAGTVADMVARWKNINAHGNTKS